MKKTTAKKQQSKKVHPKKPRFTGWLSSDEEEIDRRKYRAIEEKITVSTVNIYQEFFGEFSTQSSSGQTYTVEIRSLNTHINSCTCPDYLVNALGTCKHIEATLLKLQKGKKRRFKLAAELGSPKIEIFLDTRVNQISVCLPQRSRVNANTKINIKSKLKQKQTEFLSAFFSDNNILTGNPLTALAKIDQSIEQSSWQFKKNLNLSKLIKPWRNKLLQQKSQQKKRNAFNRRLQKNDGRVKGIDLPLYSYQQQGMLHLAFTERAMLADEMGLGKTVQAIAACAILKSTKAIKRVLVIAPASLKSEWEEQIDKFTQFSSQIVIGSRKQRLKQYADPSFFNLLNYEQIRPDFNEINTILKPDVIILDEAQRIKNWQTKTAASVKRLFSPFAFVLTGTPLENRIDEVYSLVQFLDPTIFGPLFRFNRDFHQLDETGRAIGYKNLDILNDRLSKVMLRRRKEQVEGQLPGRSDKNYFVGMNKEQSIRYHEYNELVSRMAARAKQRPLTKEEMEKMQRWLACMRMLCDTTYILDQSDKSSPKIKELAKILQDIFSDGEHKIIIFSEWERMLVLVKEYLETKHWDFAWHTGSTSQPERRAQINYFKKDPECRFFLSTDSGSVGLNLQAANVVINLDLPWNPAKLEQRIARAWRKHQTRPVQVINIICEYSIEHKMLGLLAQKTLLADHVIDGKVEQTKMNLPSGRAAFLKRVDELLDKPPIESSVTTERTSTPKTPSEKFTDSTTLIEIHQLNNDKTALVVTEKIDLSSKEKIKDDIVRQTNDDKINLEIIDQQTYETIQRLIAAGILAPTSLTPTILHKNPLVKSLTEDIRKQRLAKTRKQFAIAEHKHKMANLLGQGDFLNEALIALLEAVEIALRALFYYSGNDSKKEINASNIKSILQATDLAPHNASQYYTELQKISSSDQIGDCKNLLTTSDEFFKFIEMKLTSPLT